MSNKLSYQFALDKHNEDLEFVDLDLTTDLNLYVDPILLYRSSIPQFNEAHTLIVEFFKRALSFVSSGNNDKAKRMCQFPDAENYLGIATSKPGHGPRKKLGEKIYNELVCNQDIQKHGLMFLNEFQLLIEDISFDLISDAAVQISKEVFIIYTQQICKKYKIPLKEVPVHHCFDWASDAWMDKFDYLPVNPLKNGQPFLITPRTIVRRYPHANYIEFYKEIYRYILKHREESKWAALGKEPKISFKEIEDKYKIIKGPIVDYVKENPAEKRRFFGMIRPSEETAWLEALSLSLGINVNQLITTDILDYLNNKLIRKETKKVVSDIRKAVEHQQALKKPKRQIIPGVEQLTQKCKEDVVLLLGNFNEGHDRLNQIKTILSKTYQVIRVDDLKQHCGDSILHVVLRLGTLARFIVMEDSLPAGQLYELSKIEGIGLIMAIVREKGKSSSFMSTGASMQFNNIEEFEYDIINGEITEAHINNAVTWAERRLKETSEFWAREYPWRM